MHEGAAVWLLPYFLYRNAINYYQKRSSSLESTRRHRRAKRQKITWSPESVHYFLSTYETSDVINDSRNTVRGLLLDRYTVQEYAKELAGCDIKGSNIFDDNELKKIFRSRLHGRQLPECTAILVSTPIDMDAHADHVCLIDRRHAWYSQARAQHAMHLALGVRPSRTTARPTSQTQERTVAFALSIIQVRMATSWVSFRTAHVALRQSSRP